MRKGENINSHILWINTCPHLIRFCLITHKRIKMFSPLSHKIVFPDTPLYNHPQSLKSSHSKNKTNNREQPIQRLIIFVPTRTKHVNNNEIWDEPCYYGPGPDWTPDIIISSQVQNEEKENINGIRVVSSYMNQEDSLITDTAYTESREIEHYTVGGIAINTFKFEEYPPKKSEMYLEYTDVDGEKIGAYQTKKIRIQDLGKEGKVTLLKEEKKEEE